MQTKPRATHVFMPDDSIVEVTFYCSDTKLMEKQKQKLTELVIQLHDCTCIMKIGKSVFKKTNELENMVHHKVINVKGHLC